MIAMNEAVSIRSKRSGSGSELPECDTSKRCKIEISLRVTDVAFFGQEDLTLQHPGNAAFVDTLQRCNEIYHPQPRDVTKISKIVVDGLFSHEPPVRFLFPDKKAAKLLWGQLSISESVAVTRHALLTIIKKQQILCRDEDRKNGEEADSKRRCGDSSLKEIMCCQSTKYSTSSDQKVPQSTNMLCTGTPGLLRKGTASALPDSITEKLRQGVNDSSIDNCLCNGGAHTNNKAVGNSCLRTFEYSSAPIKQVSGVLNDPRAPVVLDARLHSGDSKDSLIALTDDDLKMLMENLECRTE